jgi:hypothetical protein
LLSRPIVMLSRLELHHTNVHRFGTSPVCQRTVSGASEFRPDFRLSETI